MQPRGNLTLEDFAVLQQIIDRTVRSRLDQTNMNQTQNRTVMGTSNSNYTEDGQRMYHSHKNIISFDHTKHGDVYETWRAQMQDECWAQRRTGPAAVSYILGWITLTSRRMVEVQVYKLRNDYQPHLDPDGSKLVEDFWNIMDQEFSSATDKAIAQANWENCHRGKHESISEWHKRCYLLFTHCLTREESRTHDYENSRELISKFVKGIRNTLLEQAVGRYQGSSNTTSSLGTFTGCFNAANRELAAIRHNPSCFKRTDPWSVKNIEDMFAKPPTGHDKTSLAPRVGPSESSVNAVVPSHLLEDDETPFPFEGALVGAVTKSGLNPQYSRWKSSKGVGLDNPFEGQCDTCGGYGHKKIHCPSRNREAAAAAERVIRRGNQKSSPRKPSKSSNRSRLVAAVSALREIVSESEDEDEATEDDHPLIDITPSHEETSTSHTQGPENSSK